MNLNNSLNTIKQELINQNPNKIPDVFSVRELPALYGSFLNKVEHNHPMLSLDKTKEVTDVLGELTNNETYFFVEQDGKYVPTNSKTYQVANGGRAGIGSCLCPGR